MGFRHLIPFIVLALLAGSAFAHDDEAALPSPGVKPGSFLWGIDRALENIKMFLTFDRAERIRIGLAVAAERLAEANAAIDADAPEALNAAVDAREAALNRVLAQLSKYSNDDKVAEYAFVQEILAGVHAQQDVLDAREAADEAVTVSLNSMAGHTDAFVEQLAERKARIKESALANAGKKKAEIEAQIDALEIEIADTDEHIDESEQDEDAVEDEPTESETMDEHELDDVASDDSITGAVVDETPSVTVVILAEVAGNETDVTVTGDITRKFTLDITEMDELVTQIAKLLDISEDQVQDSITVEVAAAKPVVDVLIEGNEIARITVINAGVTKKITLAITDPVAIIKEVAKRTNLNETLIEDVMTIRNE